RRRRAVAVRAFFRALFALILRIFFRRIEVSGAERVPRHGAVIFVVNHPSGLIDPAFLLCLAPRRVSLLAKAPLFRMPVIGFFCRAFQAIPVHRRQDAGSDPSQNRETFDTARAVRELKARIEQALAAVTLQAEQAEAHALVDRAQRIVSVQDESPASPAPLAAEFALRRRLLAGYGVVRAQWPERFAALATRIDRYEAALSAAGLDPRQLAPGRFTLGRVAGYVGKAALLLMLLLPAAL